MARGDIKAACWAVMDRAYAINSDNGRLPVPVRNLYYVVRRLTGLGAALGAKYFYDGTGNGGINPGGILGGYMLAHSHTATWDIIRDERGTFVPPHDGDSVGLGTIPIRNYLANLDSFAIHPLNAIFRLEFPRRGPGDMFGAVVYLEKEGFREIIAADGLQNRLDIAIMSSKGFSNDAARLALKEFFDAYQIPVFAVHDMDKEGCAIADLIPDAIDIGLRWDDINDPRWVDVPGEPNATLLTSSAEPVEYKGGKGVPFDPRPNMIDHGLDQVEIDFLCDTAIVPNKAAGITGQYSGQRVELNALTGPLFITWLEEKLVSYGVTKLVPDSGTVEDAYRRMWEIERTNRRLRILRPEVRQEAAAVELPEDLVTQVTERLEEDPSSRWDEVLGDIVQEAMDEADEEAEEEAEEEEAAEEEPEPPPTKVIRRRRQKPQDGGEGA